MSARIAKVQTAATLVLSAAIVAPTVLPRGWDSFPISSYPMFSRGDVGRLVAVSHALLVAHDGTRRPAAPSIVGTPEPMVAKALVETAIARGTAMELCGRIASRVPAGDAERVEIVTSVFDSARYFASEAGRAPVRRDVYATCAVKPP